MKSLSLILLLFGFQLQAQNKFITEYRFEQKVTISDGGNSNASAIINILAEGNGKSPRSTFFHFSFGQVLKVITREPKFVYQVTSEVMRLSGDINYRGFDMSDYLLPLEVKFALRQKAKSGLFWDRPLQAAIDSGKIGLCTYNDADSSASKFFNFDLINFNFKFGPTTLLQQKVQQINDYYASITALDKAFGLTQTINPFTYENFRNNQRNIMEVENVLRAVFEANHESALPLTANDPGKLLEKRTILSNLIQIKRTEFNQVLSNLHFTFLERAMGFIRTKNLDRAREYLHWALEVNPMFTPALFQLAFIDYREGNLHEAVCKADDILYNMPLDPETKRNTIDLLQEIYAVYIEKGQSAYAKRAYGKAIDEYESARIICEKYAGVACNEDLQQGMSQAKNGIYNDYLNDARELVIMNEFSQAEIITQTALHYQDNNKKYIPSGTEAAQLIMAIRQKKYDYTINSAIRLTDQKMHDAALEKLAEADSLAELHHLNPSKDFRTLVYNAARPRTLELIFEGMAYVKSNQLNFAREKFTSAEGMINTYFLKEDKEIIKQLEALRKNIFTQQCINAQISVDSTYNRGQEVEVEMNYLEANSSYKFGIEVANARKECAINIDSLESAVAHIRPAVTYLELMQGIKKNDATGRFQLAIDDFEKASNYYLDAKINNFGLIHDPDLFSYLKVKGSNGLLNYAAARYIEKNELDHSLTLYKLLISRNYDLDLIEGSLYKLGYQLGQTDKKLNPGSSWRELVKEYTREDKRLKRLRKGYKKGFRSN